MFFINVLGVVSLTTANLATVRTHMFLLVCVLDAIVNGIHMNLQSHFASQRLSTHFTTIGGVMVL